MSFRFWLDRATACHSVRSSAAWMVACILAVTSADAGVTYSGFLPFSAPGIGTSQPTIINGPWEEPAYTASNFFGTNTVQAVLKLEGLDIKVLTYSDVQNVSLTGGNLQEVSASVSVSVMGQLSGGSGAMPSELTLSASLGGQVTVGTNSFHDGKLQFGSASINSFEDFFLTDPGTQGFARDLQTTIPVDSSGSFLLSYGLSSQSFSRSGITAGNFANTFELTSILLPSGVTPESQGFTLALSDGFVSPNEVIPEPTSVWLLAAAAAIGRRVRGKG